jgi:DNA-binding NtrC family response regulator
MRRHVAIAGRRSIADEPRREGKMTDSWLADRAVASNAGVAEDDPVLELADGATSVLVADPVMKRLYALVGRVAASDLSAVVVGETGTGKEHVARALHNQSERASRPFVAVNCASISDNLAESELFGHEKGSFSGALATKAGFFEAADGGTLFLDEVGELPLAQQPKLLRALESKRIVRVGSARERPVDVRIVAATHCNLEELVAKGRFRQDLLFRLAGATIALPPLRDRPRDIAALARAFLDRACGRVGRPRMTIPPTTMAALQARAWPGNVRELKNAMDYAAATAGEAVLCVWHLSPPGDSEKRSLSPSIPSAAIRPQEFRRIADEIQALERQRMREALDATQGNQTRAAALIGMPLRTFVTKLRAYGLRLA